MTAQQMTANINRETCPHCKGVGRGTQPWHMSSCLGCGGVGTIVAPNQTVRVTLGMQPQDVTVLSTDKDSFLVRSSVPVAGETLFVIRCEG